CEGSALPVSGRRHDAAPRRGSVVDARRGRTVLAGSVAPGSMIKKRQPWRTRGQAGESLYCDRFVCDEERGARRVRRVAHQRARRRATADENSVDSVSLRAYCFQSASYSRSMHCLVRATVPSTSTGRMLSVGGLVPKRNRDLERTLSVG